jgi:hypothetical protein
MRDMIARVLSNIKAFFDLGPPCHKTAMGYNCKHRLLPNGQKECGRWNA